MKKKKIIIYSIIFILLFFLVFYVIFSNHDIGAFYENIKLLDYKYIIISLILVFMYFLCQGIYMKYMLNVLDVSITLVKGLYYSIVEFLFNAITPGATGGQPLQLFYMVKDKIPATKSIIVLLINTMIFKVFLIIGGIFIIIFRNNYIFDNGTIVNVLFWFGLLVDVFIILAYLMLMYNQKFIKKLFNLFYRIKKKIFKKSSVNGDKGDEIIGKYVNEAIFLKNNYKKLFIPIIITFIQRIFMFSITYVLYRGLGFSDFSYIDLLLLQIFIQITIEGIIIPGAMGVSEYVNNNMYVIIFGTLSISGMIVSRALSFYIPLLVIVFIIVFVTRFGYLKNK